MPDPARMTQAKPLEIPVVVQGSRGVEGTDRREIFTENATTTLVFDNGTVLNLHVRLAAGQSVFLRNELSGREILCKVKQAPAEGQSGFTDLEFVQLDPEFWDPDSATKKPLSAREKIDAAVAQLDQPEGQRAAASDAASAAGIATLPAEPLMHASEPAAAEAKADAPSEQLMAASEPAPEAPPETAPVPEAVSSATALQSGAEGAVASTETQPPASAEQQTASVGTAPQSQPVPEAGDNTLAMMGAASENVTIPKAPATIQEQLVAAHEVTPEGQHVSAVVPALDESSVPTGDEIDAALQKMGGAPIPGMTALKPQSKPAAQSAAVAVEDEPQEAPVFTPTLAEKFAALLAGDARRARHAAAEKEKEAQKAAAALAAPEDTEGAEGELNLVPKMTLEQRLTTGKGAWAVGIAAAAVILMCLLLIWRAVYVPGATNLFPRQDASNKQNKKTLASFFHRSPKQAAVLAAPVKSGAANAGPAMQASNGGAKQAQAPAAEMAPARVASKTSEQRVQLQNAHAAGTTKTAAPAPPISAEPNSTPVVTPSVSSEPNVVESTSAPDSGTAPETLNPSTSTGRESDGNIPARIISEVQPTFPYWAKSLDVYGVVKLDAVIDENGNLKSAKPLSGPRALQHAAQQAVTLWIFAPAQQNGKPVASHLILSVAFQR